MTVSVRIAAVPFAPNYYVTDDGRVFREVKCSDDGNGYHRVDLPHAGKAHYSVRVNRLIAGAFLPQPLPGQVMVRHMDGNSTNNNFSNLAWGTAQDNSDDRDRHGTTRRGDNHPNTKITDDLRHEIRALFSQGWSQRSLALRFGVDRQTINRIVRIAMLGASTPASEIDRLQRKGDE